MGELLMYGLFIFGLIIFGKIGGKFFANLAMVGSLIAGLVFAVQTGYVSQLTSIPVLQVVLPFVSAGGIWLLLAIIIKDMKKDHRADEPAILSAFAFSSVVQLGWEPLVAFFRQVEPSLNQLLGTLG